MRFDIINDYKKIIEQLPDLIKTSGRSQKEIYLSLNWTRQKWSRRVKEKNFTPDELERVLKAIGSQ
jgi:predicted XRE-type DNA-binding protein